MCQYIAMVVVNAIFVVVVLVVIVVVVVLVVIVASVYCGCGCGCGTNSVTNAGDDATAQWAEAEEGGQAAQLN